MPTAWALGWDIRLRPTWSLELARPRGCLALDEPNSSRGISTVWQAAITTLAGCRWDSSCLSTYSTASAEVPSGDVVMRASDAFGPQIEPAAGQRRRDLGHGSAVH